MLMAGPAVGDDDRRRSRRPARRTARGCSARRSQTATRRAWSVPTALASRPRCASRSRRRAAPAGHRSSRAGRHTGPTAHRLLADRVDAAGADSGAEQLPGQLAGAATRDPVARRQRNDRRPQPGPERRPGDPRRQPGRRLDRAAAAAQPLGAMLDDEHADRRQLADLTTTEPAARPTLILCELVPAAAASIRVVLDDLVDLVLGRQPATGAPMALLRARLVPASALGQQLLGLRACFLAPLLTRLGWILRWRPRTRPRVTPRLILKPPDPLLQPLHRRGQLQQSLHARLAPTVVDRIGLSPFHNRNIRPRDVGALLWNPELNGYATSSHSRSITWRRSC